MVLRMFKEKYFALVAKLFNLIDYCFSPYRHMQSFNGDISTIFYKKNE